MIFFDVTKTTRARHRSGIMRVSARLREELGTAAAAPVVWRDKWCGSPSGQPVKLTEQDWLLTPELFSESERPGFWNFLRAAPCRTAAIFHDAIPLKFPRTTWPQSVARHPEYLKMLALFDRVFAVSEASQAELTSFWKWQNAEVRATVDTLSLGADFSASPRPTKPPERAKAASPLLLSIGIIEPRKNQGFLVDVAETLAREGIDFQLEIVGRVNPHFGKPIERRLRRLSRMYPQINYRGSIGDSEVTRLWEQAQASVFCTLAEGCGLPVLESLWMNVPCICSDLPVLRENGSNRGCEFVKPNDHHAWSAVLRKVLTDDTYAVKLRNEATQRVLPTWRQTSEYLKNRLAV